jgi:hypothetical protein
MSCGIDPIPSGGIRVYEYVYEYGGELRRKHARHVRRARAESGTESSGATRRQLATVIERATSRLILTAR